MRIIIALLVFAGSVAASAAQIPNPKRILQKKSGEVIDSVLAPKPEPKEDEEQEEGNSERPAKTDTGKSDADLQTYSKYDFMPGEKVVFFEDFSQEAIGDFPAAWNTNGSAEVVTTNLYPGKWLKFSMSDALWTDALLDLPENYTIEFDVVPIYAEDGEMPGYQFRLIQSINERSFDYGAVPGKAGLLFACEGGRNGYRTYINSEEGDELGLGGYKDGDQYTQQVNKLYHVAIWIQKSRVRVYLDQHKLFDLPKAFPLPGVKMDRLRFETGAAMFSNLRVAIGAPDIRNKLLTEGKLVSYGIYFDVNKDAVKPTSYASLKEIAGIMKDNPDLRIRIVGHTDSDGTDAANLDLSKRRAVSVKTELVKSFGIDERRLEAEGAGESQPIAPNDNASNKALNRRVEFIRL
ncbi:MAG TPA: OmpA family protein [Chitinophagaceae bacterium]